VPHPGSGRQGPPSRRDLLDLLEGRSLTDLDPNVLAALASLDGAIIVDRNARLLAAGAILRHPPSAELEAGVVEGARTTAALAASRFGPVLKVSEDGIITFFDGERVWDI
jgi:DNA integrity scanning protein DisA with diadenylate cyclase activity